jgi:hypothetical protein
MEQPIYTANYLRGKLIEYDDFIKEEKSKNLLQENISREEKKVIL